MAVVATVVVVAVRGGTPPWTLALSLLAVGALVLRLASPVDYSWGGTPWDSATMVLGLAQSAAVLCAGAWVAVASRRALRDLRQAGIGFGSASLVGNGVQNEGPRHG